MATTLAAALKLAEQRNLRFVSLQFTDIVGQVKSVQVPMHQLEEAVEHGKWFDGSSIEGFARIAESDMFLVPDLDTFAAIPWEPGLGVDGKEKLHTGSARVICDPGPSTTASSAASSESATTATSSRPASGATSSSTMFVWFSLTESLPVQ